MLEEFFSWSEDSVKKIGKPVIGWTCAYMPEEIILAAGAHPFRLHGKELEHNRCDEYLPNFFCPYGANIANTALNGEYDFLDAMIFTNSCNAMERVYDVWNEFTAVKHGYMLDVPRVDSSEARVYYEKAIRKLLHELENQFAIHITEEDLKRAIKQTNRTRTLLRELSEIALEGKAGIATKELLQIIDACSYMERQDYNESLERYLAVIKDRRNEKRKRAARIMLAGCVMCDNGLIEIIEHTGAVVVGDELCTGSRYYNFTVEETGDPIAEISKAYLAKSPCPRMEKSASVRGENLISFIEENDIDAVVYHSLKFCINHSYDFMLIKELLNEEGIPVLFAESDYNQSGQEQLRIRVEAFMEMLS